MKLGLSISILYSREYFIAGYLITGFGCTLLHYFDKFIYELNMKKNFKTKNYLSGLPKKQFDFSEKNKQKKMFLSSASITNTKTF